MDEEREPLVSVNEIRMITGCKKELAELLFLIIEIRKAYRYGLPCNLEPLITRCETETIDA